ncbi:MAG: DUF2877 domain-containing protein [Lachnospiraceae bacterium]|nr:DUF2877 domain-containing protein [Lachnospiraceae bacterium]
MIEAASVCDRLLRDVGQDTCSLQVHSMFDTAVNFTSAFGIVTVLSPGRSLQPYAMVLCQDFDFHFFEYRVSGINDAGVHANGIQVIDFSCASRPDLSIEGRKLPAYDPAEAALGHIRSFLKGHCEEGLSRLVFHRLDNAVTGFLYPRIEAFRKAAAGSDDEAFIRAAYEISGCGEGLTPSSDDFLSGYLLCAGFIRGREVTKAAAYMAAERTNDISAALLKRSGEGLYSEDILALLTALGSADNEEEINRAISRVAEFGSSSGCDFLTGLYFGIKDLLVRKEE